GDAGERPCRTVKDQGTLQERYAIRRHGQHGKHERSDAGGKNGGGGGAVRRHASERCVDGVHRHLPRTRCRVAPPSTGAFLLSIAPKNPAIAAEQNETSTKPSTALRSGGGGGEPRSPYLKNTAAAIVIEIGASHATCSFHSMPIVCHWAMAGLDRSERCGYPASSDMFAGAA